MKQKEGLHMKKIEGGGMFQFQPRPSVILWYDDDLPGGTDGRSLESLTATAVEVFTLDGLSRDDIREMLEVLLPDHR
jgi:hypothetical protein